MRYHRIKRITIGAAFEVGKRSSRVTVEYQLVVDVPANKSQSGRREYVSADIGFTATSVDAAASEAYDHAEKTASSLFANMLKVEDDD